MTNIINLLLVVLVWVFSLVNTSGLGAAYDTPTKMFWLIGITFVMMSQNKKNQRIPVGGKNSYLLFFTLLSFVILPVIIKGSWQGFTYLMTIPLIYIFSQRKVSDSFIQLSGYIVAGLGAMILYVYEKTDILSGWNDNAISMVGLWSYLYYSIGLFGNLTGRKITLGLAISIYYIMTLTSSTDSRSCAIFIMMAMVLAYWTSIGKKIVGSNWKVSLAISIPLIIAIIVVLFPQFSVFKYIDEWSQTNYGKSVFNGRDELWAYSFSRLPQDYFIGFLKFNINHHNSAVAILSVFGVVGYLCWYMLFKKVFTYMRKYVADNIVMGSIFAFLLIYWQQSFDLGLVSECPNMIPYMIIGIGLGRIKTLQNYA